MGQDWDKISLIPRRYYLTWRSAIKKGQAPPAQLKLGQVRPHHTHTPLNGFGTPVPPMHSNLLKLTPQKSALQPTVPGNFVGIVNVLAQFCCVVGAAGVFTFDDLNAQGIHCFIPQALKVPLRQGHT